MAAAAPQPGGAPSPREKRRRLPRVPVVRAPRTARPPALPAPELFRPLGEPPPPEGRAGAPLPVCGRRRPGPQRPRHVRTIFEPEAQRGRRHRFRPEEALRTWCDLCCRFIFSQSLRCAGVLLKVCTCNKTTRKKTVAMLCEPAFVCEEWKEMSDGF
ncbi:ras association domain-containing protein 5-like [Emydura macquarii macquarii]|uniref:ras association domain-containing protein 5-like n=1 Tax=Emydura macquarii macquarii TaxID=1129001 RepID=UPI00352A748F